MIKEILYNTLHSDEKEGSGIILRKSDTTIFYEDYTFDIEIPFHYDESLTDDFVASKMYVTKSAKKRGLTPDIILQVLKHAYGDDYKLMLSTFRCLIIADTEDEFYEALEKYEIDKELHDYPEEELGMMLFASQTVFINHQLHISLAKELADYFFQNRKNMKQVFW